MEKPNLLKHLLARRDEIGPAYWELLWILCQDTGLVSIGKCAVALSKNRHTVSRNFRRLEECKILDRQSVPGRPHIYTLHLCNE